MKKTIVTSLLLASTLIISGQAHAERINHIGAVFGSSTLSINTQGNTTTSTETGYGIARHDVGDTRSLYASYMMYASHSVASLKVFYNVIHNNSQWTVGLGGGAYLDLYDNTNSLIDYKGLTLDANASYDLSDSHLSLNMGYSTRLTGLDGIIDGYNTMYAGISLGF